MLKTDRIKKLETTPSHKVLIVLTGVSTVLTIIIFMMMRPVEAALKAASPYGVMELEFAWTVDKMNLILTTWEQADSSFISQEIFVTLLDYGFLIAYSTLFACITLLISRKLLYDRIQLAGYYLTFASFIAALFDGLENLNLIMMLSSPSNFPNFSPFLASTFALFKFSLLILIICFWIVCTVWVIIKR
ncbi:MAG: hypothetical protein ACW964_19455, partial [Candidatus Hodarchaeales archaeon]